MVAFALAMASEADDYRDRELGPIHLLKYLYLGDLAFAEINDGKSYSEAHWRFYKFGPWSAEVYEYLPRAGEVAGANVRHFESIYSEDGVRWSLPEPSNVDDIGSQLPPIVARAIKESVKVFHNDTYTLLHYVYRTAPMLTAAPGEALVFQVREEAGKYATTTPESEAPRKISKTQLKRIKERVRSYLADRGAHRKTVSPTVSYDADYFEILDLLDKEAGETIEESDGVLEFSTEVWKSEARRGSGIP
jgi:hypothetical protein